jgi:SAM-dependent methyltransferase
MLNDDSNVHLSYAPYLWAMLAVGQPPPSSSLDRSMTMAMATRSQTHLNVPLASSVRQTRGRTEMTRSRTLILRSMARRIVPEAARPRLKTLYRALTWRFYTGDRYRCPCCETTFRRFLDFGRGARGGSRSNVRCPRCGSLERERLLWLFLRSRSDLLAAPCRILHIAPEPQLERQLRGLPGVKYVSGDLSSARADVVVDIRSMTFAPGSFDGVICNHVLEHVPEDQQAMREIHRVLSPGGWAILQVPVDQRRAVTDEDPTITDRAVRAVRFGQADHVRVYGRDYAARLTAAGFDVSEESGPSDLTSSDVDRFRLRQGDVIYFCRAPRNG